MHLQQQQQQQLLAGQNGAMFGSQAMFMQAPVTTSCNTPSDSKLPTGRRRICFYCFIVFRRNNGR